MRFSEGPLAAGSCGTSESLESERVPEETLRDDLAGVARAAEDLHRVERGLHGPRGRFEGAGSRESR
jgi:hypothetical protein